MLRESKQLNKITKCRLNQAKKAEARARADYKEASGCVDLLRQELSDAKGAVERLSREAEAREALLQSLWKQCGGSPETAAEATATTYEATA